MKDKLIITFFKDHDGEYDGNTIDDMWTDYDYHVNTGKLTDWFPEAEPNPDDYADWD